MFPRVDLKFHHRLISLLFFVIFRSTLMEYVSGQQIQLVNTTMEESDPSIVYLPNGVDRSPATWQTHTSSNFGNGVMYACENEISCIATVKFVGVAVYYYAALWPWNISVILTLDNGPNELVDLRDKTDPNSLQGVVGKAKSTQNSDIRWSREGLTNQEHTLVVSMGDGTTSQWALVDRLVFTSIKNSTSSASLTDPSASPSSTLTPHPSSSSEIKLTSVDNSISTASRTDALASTSTPSSSSSSKTPLNLGLAFGITGAILLFLLNPA